MCMVEGGTADSMFFPVTSVANAVVQLVILPGNVTADLILTCAIQYSLVLSVTSVTLFTH